MQIENKNVIITGAAQGIGRSLAKSFAQQKANLILIDIDAKGLQTLKNNLPNAKSVKTFKTDLTNFNQVKKLTKKIINQFNRVDILINNAGIGIYKHIEEQDLNTWQKAIDLNISTPFLLTKNLLPMMRNSKEKAFVINMGSGCGIKGVKGRVSYCTTKFALRGMSFSLHKELKDKINVIHLALGSVMTDFGPLETEDKKDLEEQDKNYLTTQQVSDKILELIRTDFSEKEYEFYPKGYFDKLGD
jgi:short-subunit dehydrogenase